MIDRKLEVYFTTGKPLTIQILRPANGRITDDLMAALASAQVAFTIREETFHAGNPQSVAKQIRKYGSVAVIDSLCVVRGGGKEQNASVFNAPAVLEALGSATLPVVAAIGHNDDVTLFQKYADESFHTPTALGHWLQSKYLEVEERLGKTKAMAEENNRLKAQLDILIGRVGVKSAVPEKTMNRTADDRNASSDDVPNGGVKTVEMSMPDDRERSQLIIRQLQKQNARANWFAGMAALTAVCSALGLLMV